MDSDCDRASADGRSTTYRTDLCGFQPTLSPTIDHDHLQAEQAHHLREPLQRRGVLVAKKDYNAPKHEDLDVPNLEVIKAMQSLTSKGFVKTQFSWQYYYYTLTNEGLDYLREWLHLPAEIVPETHRKPARQPKPAAVRPGGEGAYRPPRGDRDDYRRRDDGAKKEEGAGADFRPRFSGVGRGAPTQ
ncbi:Plectin/S10 domain, partial [Rhizoctonia solani]